jgi:arylsulfatase
MKPIPASVLLAAGLCAVRLVAAPPNIIVIISDDQGYGELSAHGNPVVRTPHLDRLHGESVRFTDFHVAPMCTPTRGQLMTGCDAVRTGALNVSSGRTLLRRGFPTLPERLRTGGYASGLFGKWHLGDNYPYRPQDRGFDEVVTFPSSHIGSVPDAWQNDYFDDTYLHNGRPRAYRGYTTDVFFDEAMAWMRTQRTAGKPFFTYIATAAPHSPLYVPAKNRESAAVRLAAVRAQLPALTDAQAERIARYLAMIENLDDNVGRLESFLAAENLRRDTVLVFLTDNGTTFGDIYFPAGMRGKKVTLWEGGHRVPLFIRWPGGDLGPPRDVSILTHVQDLFPTLLEIARVEKPNGPFEGWSLAPLMRGIISTLPDRALFINYSRMPVAGNVPPGVDPATACEVRPEGTAVLWNRWRWLENKSLYDLRTDPLQQRDVAAEHPEIAALLRAKLAAWWQQWGGNANKPEAVVIGHDAENPLLLTACEWWDVFVDQQSQIRSGEPKRGFWHVDVDRAGDYLIELRRWPRDADLPLAAAAPAATLADGALPAGKALPIARAELRAGAHAQTLELAPDAKHATFRVRLAAGPTKLEGIFSDATGRPLVGSYYAYVQRL